MMSQSSNEKEKDKKLPKIENVLSFSLRFSDCLLKRYIVEIFLSFVL